jgi:hypothetical protein
MSGSAIDTPPNAGIQHAPFSWRFRRPTTSHRQHVRVATTRGTQTHPHERRPLRNFEGGSGMFFQISGSCRPVWGLEMDDGAVTEWIRAGATALGGSKLITRTIVEERSWDLLIRNARRVIELIRAVRTESVAVPG